MQHCLVGSEMCIRDSEYAVQADRLKSPVLYVNSVCYDFDEPYISKGGACYFDGGEIIKEVPSGAEAVLKIEIN